MRGMANFSINTEISSNEHGFFKFKNSAVRHEVIFCHKRNTKFNISN